jgi:hypothetical protein
MRIALTRLGISPVNTPQSYASAWRREASREALEDLGARYACSPRNTRGATRA